MPLSKFMKAVVPALEDPGDPQKLRRLWSRIGYTLAREPSRERDQALEIMEIFCRAKTSLPHPLTDRLNAAGEVIRGFRGGTASLDNEVLRVMTEEVLAGSRQPEELFRLVGSSLVSGCLGDLRSHAPHRQRLAIAAMELEQGDEATRHTSMLMQVVTDIVCAFEADTRPKFCERCASRMRAYWTVNPRPYVDERGRVISPYSPRKICEACKNDEEFMKGRLLDSPVPHLFP